MQSQEDSSSEQSPNIHSMVFVPVKISLQRPQLLPFICSFKRCYIQLVCALLLLIIIFIIHALSNVRRTFVSYHTKSDTDGELVVLPKDFARARNALCLDGSSAGYYIRLGRRSGQGCWILFLQGGGWCSSLEECYDRSSTSFGSSILAPVFSKFGGILSSSEVINPDFYDWNVVQFLYCDGGAFLGNHSEPVLHNSILLHFRGSYIFDAIIDFMLEHTDFNLADKVILGGTSVGGLAALIHADHLRQKLQHIRSLHVVLDSILFVDPLSPEGGSRAVMNILNSTFVLQSMKDAVALSECTKNQLPDNKWQCLSPLTFYKHLFTQAFFVNSVHDLWYLHTVLKTDCDWFMCSPEKLEDIKQFRDSVVQNVQQIVASWKDGILFTSCPIHSILLSDSMFKAELVNNVSPQKAISEWYFGRKNVKIINVEDILKAVTVCP